MLLPFTRFPEEGQKIGWILAAYADLEISLMNCVQVVGPGLDLTLKEMFRVRGETRRVNRAAQLGLPEFERLGLQHEFESTIESMRHCLAMRNQYAHGLWHDDNTGRMCFVALEDAAQSEAVVNNLLGLPFYYVDVPLLESQCKYFQHTEAYQTWLNFEGQLRAERIGGNPFPALRPIEPPPYHY